MSEPTYDGFEPSRYERKPFLRVLECYVLWSIDELSPEDAAQLEQMAPKLGETFNLAGEWHQVVAQYMEFTPATPRQIAAVWQRERQAAERKGESLMPQPFAERFVDTSLNTDRI